MSRVSRRSVPTTIVAMVALVACSDGGSPATTTTAATEVTTTGSSAVASTTEGGVSPSTSPATAVTTNPAEESAAGLTLDAQLDWFLEVMNGTDPTAAEYAERFAPAFTSQVSFEDFIAPLPQFRGGLTGWFLSDTEDRDDRSGVFLLAPEGGEPVLKLTIGLAPELGGAIETLFVGPAEAPSLEDPPATFDEVVAELGEMGRTAALVADVSAGECAPVGQADADTIVPIGSVFKLYVLGAVAEAIERGELKWGDELAVTADVLSLPSGITQDEPLGTSLTVRELAGRMIAISDNTATDMLMRAVGRAAVEDVQATMGHSDPDVNRPFFTTRELFIVKLDPELLGRYADVDSAGRRALLDEIADRPLPELGPGDFAVDPVAPDRVEWFATPSDMCRALVHLAELAERSGLQPIADVMSESPGVPSDRFDDIWFKGGSEPGLLAVAWLVRLGDSTFTVTGAVVNADAPVDETRVALLLAAMRDLIE